MIDNISSYGEKVSNINLLVSLLFHFPAKLNLVIMIFSEMITVAAVNGVRSVFRFPVKYTYNEHTVHATTPFSKSLYIQSNLY